MSQDIYGVLATEDKGLSSAENIPAKLFRLVCLDKGVTRVKWDSLLDNYVKSTRSGVSNDKATWSFTKSNINRALGKDKITWEKLKKGLSILCDGKIEFSLEINWCDSLIHAKEPPKTIEKESSGRADDLCWFFRKAFNSIDLDPMSWNTLVEKWLNNPANGVYKNKPEKSWERGNIRKHILDSNIFTWDTFVKAMSILGVDNANISVMLTKGGVKSTHTCNFKVKKS